MCFFDDPFLAIDSGGEEGEGHLDHSVSVARGSHWRRHPGGPHCRGRTTVGEIACPLPLEFASGGNQKNVPPNQFTAKTPFYLRGTPGPHGGFLGKNVRQEDVWGRLPIAFGGLCFRGKSFESLDGENSSETLERDVGTPLWFRGE